MSEQIFGQYTYGSPKVHDWNDNTRLEVGKYCSIAGGVEILIGGNHRIDWLSTFPFESLGPDTSKGRRSCWGKQPGVVIGHDVWIGTNALFVSGVTVGNGAVIAAGSVVSHDIPDYAVVAGNPAQVIKYRFDKSTIDKLLEIKWWDWEEEYIKECIPFLQDGEIKPLYNYYLENLKQ